MKMQILSTCKRSVKCEMQLKIMFVYYIINLFYKMCLKRDRMLKYSLLLTPGEHVKLVYVLHPRPGHIYNLEKWTNWNDGASSRKQTKLRVGPQRICCSNNPIECMVKFELQRRSHPIPIILTSICSGAGTFHLCEWKTFCVSSETCWSPHSPSLHPSAADRARWRYTSFNIWFKKKTLWCTVVRVHSWIKIWHSTPTLFVYLWIKCTRYMCNYI